MKATEDCVVSIHYEVKDNGNGELLDSNMDQETPLNIIMGQGQIIPGLEKSLVGMEKGQQEVFVIDPANAYGEYDEAGLMTVPKDQFTGIELSVGMTLYGQTEDGSTLQVLVNAIGENEVTIDRNHPLAGKELHFEVKVADVREIRPEDLSSCCGGDSGHSCCGGHDEDECCGGENHGKDSSGSGCGCH